MHIDRGFRTWSYRVGHSQLGLRSVESDIDDEFIGVTFNAVRGMKVKSKYSALTLEVLDASEVEDELGFAGIPRDRWSDFKCFGLNWETERGFVVCHGCAVGTYPGGTDFSLSGALPEGFQWLLKV